MTVDLIASNWQEYILVFFLILCRITPPLVFRSINPLSMLPAYIKVMVTFVFGFVIMSNVVDDSLISEAVDLKGTALAVAFLNEFIIGLTFWFALVITYGSIFMFLKLLDMQVGFNPMGIFNPAMRESEPILTRAIMVFISLLFFISGVHYALIEMLSATIQYYPVLSGVGELDLGMMMAMFSSQLILSFILALPVMVAIFWVDLMLGLCNRIMPQVNIYFVGLPAKTAVAFVVLGVSARHVSDITELLFEGVFSYWNALY